MLIKEWLATYPIKLSLPALAKQLEQYRLGYVGYTPGHVSFYGGPYIGLQNIWFTTQYENRLVGSILKLDKSDLQHDLKKVDHEGRSVLVPGIYPDRKVSGEWFNILLLYLAHQLLDTPHPHRKDVSAALIPLQLYAYRTLAAVHTNSFRYLGSEAVAKATYNQLSNKFILKQLKSWDKYIEYRTVATLNYAHERNALTLDNDEEAVMLLIITSNAIRSTFKIMYQLYLEVKDGGDTVGSDTYVKEGEEDTFLKEIVNASSLTQTLLLQVADGSFINTDIAKHVASVVPRVLFPDVLVLLKQITLNYIKNKRVVDTFIESCVAFIVDRLQVTDIRAVSSKVERVNRLYDAFGSSKTTAPVLNTVRTYGITLVQSQIPHKSEAYYIRLRSALILYTIIQFVNLA